MQIGGFNPQFASTRHDVPHCATAFEEKNTYPPSLKLQDAIKGLLN